MNRAFHCLSLRVLSLGITSLMILQTMLAAQSGSGLAIQVLDSAGQTLISQETRPIKVRILDRTGRAISGANVLFVAPEEGPTGLFLPNASQVNVATDSQGMATAPRFRTNNTVGEYQIQVVASYRDAVSRVVIPQSNVVKRKPSTKKILIFSALIGGAAVAALAARGGSTPASPALSALAATPTINLGGESAVSLTPPVSVSPPALIITPQIDSTPVLVVPPSDPASTATTVPTTSSPAATFPAVATSPASAPVQAVQPIPQVLPPIPQILPSISDVCARMPPQSNRRDCR